MHTLRLALDARELCMEEKAVLQNYGFYKRSREHMKNTVRHSHKERVQKHTTKHWATKLVNIFAESTIYTRLINYTVHDRIKSGNCSDIL